MFGGEADVKEGDRLTGLAVTGESLKSFSYDSFGRMTSDGLDGVTVDYNCFDLPRKISSGGVTLRDRFTGKEEQTPDFGIGFTDFGARLLPTGQFPTSSQNKALATFSE